MFFKEFLLIFVTKVKTLNERIFHIINLQSQKKNILMQILYIHNHIFPGAQQKH